MRLLPLVAALSAIVPHTLPAQSATANPERGRALYSQRCESCHGPNAFGGDRGPSLANNRRLRRNTFAETRDTIRKGKPDSGMPPFELPAPELDDIAIFIHSLNAPAASSHPPGDRAAGERFFFGAGQCATCHMVMGRGRPIGPDLSDIGHEM